MEIIKSGTTTLKYTLSDTPKYELGQHSSRCPAIMYRYLQSSGEGKQMVDDGEPFPVRAGDVIFIPTAIYHSTINTGWDPLRLLAIYNPGGPEEGLREFARLP